MPTVRYTVINSEIIAEKRSGSRKQYVPDPIGSTAALLDNTQTKTDTYVYWPYGELLTSSRTTATPFTFVGTWGYWTADQNISYVRARCYHGTYGSWMTADPMFGPLQRFNYADANPTTLIDPLGLVACQAQQGPPTDRKGCLAVVEECKKAGLSFWFSPCGDGTYSCDCCTPGLTIHVCKGKGVPYEQIIPCPGGGGGGGGPIKPPPNPGGGGTTPPTTPPGQTKPPIIIPPEIIVGLSCAACGDKHCRGMKPGLEMLLCLAKNCWKECGFPEVKPIIGGGKLRLTPGSIFFEWRF